MLKQARVSDEFEDAFDATGQLKPGVTRVRVPLKLMDSAPEQNTGAPAFSSVRPHKVVAEPGFIARDAKTTKRGDDPYTAYDAALSERWRTADGQFCRKCGEKNDNQAAYCDQCGEQFPPDSDDDNDAADAATPTGVGSHGTRDPQVGDPCTVRSGGGRFGVEGSPGTMQLVEGNLVCVATSRADASTIKDRAYNKYDSDLRQQYLRSR